VHAALSQRVTSARATRRSLVSESVRRSLASLA